jgi:hypothetical protein
MILVLYYKLTNIFWFLSLKLALRSRFVDYRTSKKNFLIIIKTRCHNLNLGLATKAMAYKGARR